MTSLDQELDAMLGAEPAPAAVAPRVEVVGPGTPPSPMLAAWERWRPEFVKAMDGSFHTVEALEKLIFQGRAQFWPGKNAAIVTQIQDYPGERALQGLWSAGDLAEVRLLIPGVEAYGRLMGCTSVLVEGRAGWARALKDLGYEPWSVTVRKAL